MGQRVPVHPSPSCPSVSFRNCVQWSKSGKIKWGTVLLAALQTWTLNSISFPTNFHFLFQYPTSHLVIWSLLVPGSLTNLQPFNALTLWWILRSIFVEVPQLGLSHVFSRLDWGCIWDTRRPHVMLCPWALTRATWYQLGLITHDINLDQQSPCPITPCFKCVPSAGEEGKYKINRKIRRATRR